MAAQIVTNIKGEKVAVIIPIKDYNKLLEDRETLSELRAYDKVKLKKETYIPLREAMELRKTVLKKILR